MILRGQFRYCGRPLSLSARCVSGWQVWKTADSGHLKYVMINVNMPGRQDVADELKNNWEAVVSKEPERITRTFKVTTVVYKPGKEQKVKLRKTEPDLSAGTIESSAQDTSEKPVLKTESEPATSNEAQAQSNSDRKQPHIDNLDIIDLVGQGGMGCVYRAMHRVLNKDVAIKIIHKQLARDQSAIKRFDREAHAASSLTHPNVIAVYDHGTTSEGESYLLMDFVDGKSLAEIIEIEGFLDVPRALSVFIQICDALIHAHDKGIIHRDLKPSNVLLSKGAEGAELVKVVDFGLAKLLDEDAAERSDLTKTGQIFGSPSYMSPEQCLGDTVDERSDIYSLGCIMYEVLTGSPAFSGETPVHTMMKSVSDKPAKFSKRFPDLNIPEEVENIVFKALSKTPEQRYKSVEELRAVLLKGRDDFPNLKRRKTLRTVARVALVLAVGVALIDAVPFIQRFVDTSAINIKRGTAEVLPRIENEPRVSQIRDTSGKVLFESQTALPMSQLVRMAAGGMPI